MVNINTNLLIIVISIFLNSIQLVLSVCEKNCSNCKIFTNNSAQLNFLENLHMNTTVVVELKGNPSTGYGWYLSQNSLTNNGGLLPLNLNMNYSTDEYYSDDTNSQSPTVGVGGTYCFKFNLKNFNKTTLLFDYYRIWEKASSVINSLNFTFVNNAQTNLSIQPSNIVNMTISVGNYTPNFSDSSLFFFKFDLLLLILCLFYVNSK